MLSYNHLWLTKTVLQDNYNQSPHPRRCIGSENKILKFVLRSLLILELYHFQDGRLLECLLDHSIYLSTWYHFADLTTSRKYSKKYFISTLKLKSHLTCSSCNLNQSSLRPQTVFKPMWGATSLNPLVWPSFQDNCRWDLSQLSAIFKLISYNICGS